MTASSSISGVAERYAGALFELALDDKSVDAVEKELVAFNGLIGESADLERLIKSPVFSADDQFAAIDALLGKAGLSAMVSNFIRVVAKNRRLFVLPGMVKAFQEIAAEHRGEIAAEVTSAQKLKAADKKTLAATLKKKFGKDVTLTETVDPAILGGLIVKVGSQMIDSSVRSKLNSLKTMMKEVG